MKNIEIKVRVDNRTNMLRNIQKLGAKKIGLLRQTDSYYKVSNGRLKLREERPPDHTALIYYSRPDDKQSKLSEYDILNIAKDDSKKFKNILSKALSTLVVVKKNRSLYQYKNTRIHLDSVSGLGDYLELETVITKQSLSHAKNEHETVVKALELNTCEIIAVSYSDLLMKTKATVT
ncbi:MAG: class IV adenylate cyclase [Candidatus Uhrbacteria bacterium]